MHSRRTSIVLALAVIAALVLLLLNPGLHDIANRSIQYELLAFGASIYEYHDKTGRWPTHDDDFAETSLPLRIRYWKSSLQKGVVVVVWRSDLDSDPKHNPNAVLVYHNMGLLASLGHKWVCWGDLRTEYISTSRLEKTLRER